MSLFCRGILLRVCVTSEQLKGLCINSLSKQKHESVPEMSSTQLYFIYLFIPIHFPHEILSWSQFAALVLIMIFFLTELFLLKHHFAQIIPAEG